MPVAVVMPRPDLKRIIRERQRCGGDRYDEVWDGVYVMSPLADNQHQGISSGLTVAFGALLRPDPGLVILCGCNVSDRADKWTKNYRCPDVAVFLPGNPAEDRDTHWLGGPDFAVEVLSPGDRSRKKFTFYAGVGVRELLLLSRRPWRLELYRLQDGTHSLVDSTTPAEAKTLTSVVLGLTFRWVVADPRPRIEVARPDDGRSWLV